MMFFILVGTVVADIAILTTWWFLGNRLVPAELPRNHQMPKPTKEHGRCTGS